jgi:hypothetical protein
MNSFKRSCNALGSLEKYQNTNHALQVKCKVELALEISTVAMNVTYAYYQTSMDNQLGQMPEI